MKIPAAARGRTSALGFVPWRAPRGRGDSRAPRAGHDREVAAEGRGLGPPWERGARGVWCGATAGAGPGAWFLLLCLASEGQELRSGEDDTPKKKLCGRSGVFPQRNALLKISRNVKARIKC